MNYCEFCDNIGDRSAADPELTATSFPRNAAQSFKMSAK